MTKSYFLNPQNEDDLQCKMTSKYWKWNISATTVSIVKYEYLGVNLRKTQMKSRVWLCSAQLVYLYFWGWMFKHPLEKVWLNNMKKFLIKFPLTFKVGFSNQEPWNWNGRFQLYNHTNRVGLGSTLLTFSER